MSATTLRDFSRSPLRNRLEALLLRTVGTGDAPEVERFKRHTIGSLRGTVVEIGPGAGANMPFYGPDASIVAVEPNPAMHGPLRTAARTHGVSLDIRRGHGEVLHVGDGMADAVVGTLVLCGVDDPHAVLGEVRRVLRPGGIYVFYEHVRDPRSAAMRVVQRVAEPPHRWLWNGCELTRDTGAVLREVFADIQLQTVDAGPFAAYTRSRILGVARP